jgi:hypothetical protein
MTAQAGAHVMGYQAVGSGGLRHLPVACRTFDAGANMGRVLKLHQSLKWELIDPLPRDLPFAVGVRSKLLDFRFAGADPGVAQHAFPDGWQRRGSVCVGGTMAINAVESECCVLLMGIRDGLLGWKSRDAWKDPGCCSNDSDEVQIGVSRTDFPSRER